jgi:histidinol-phosphate phosphatase family protein
MTKAIFFDRDGTLIDEPSDDAVSTWEEYIERPDLDSLRQLTDAGYLIFIITNQDAIADGRLTQEFYEATNTRLLASLQAAGVPIEGIYTCPHTESDGCTCIKPKRGLIDQAITGCDIDLSNSFVVGDRTTDVLLGQAVGAKTIFLQTSRHTLEEGVVPTYACDTLSLAVEKILQP